MLNKKVQKSHTMLSSKTQYHGYKKENFQGKPRHRIPLRIPLAWEFAWAEVIIEGYQSEAGRELFELYCVLVVSLYVTNLQ